jgi:hypothetical protein
VKNIAILELHFHIKFLYTTMRIANTKNTKVTVFTTKKIHSRIKHYLKTDKDFEFVLKDEKESLSNYLSRVEKLCNKNMDLLLVNTIQMTCLYAPRYINFNPKCKKILTIHMINHWLKRKFSFNPKSILRSLDVSICIQLIRKYILPKYDAINVIYKPLKQYIKDNTDYEKPVYTIPFNFFDEQKKSDYKKKGNKIKFVVPGLIEVYRRDYDLTLNIFEQLFEKYNKNISLWILGKPIGSGGKAVIERCKKLKEKGYDISFSEKFIPERLYDKVLTESDIIFSPLNVVTKRDSGIKEIYGKTEGSALPFEAIQYAKPLIVPQEFDIENLKSSSLQYNSKKELEKMLKWVIEDEKKLDNLSKKALENSKKYSLSVLQDYFVNNLLNNK